MTGIGELTPAELLELTEYRIIKELGRGGMGVVYLAEHTFTGRKEVLKVLNERLMNHPEARKRFEQEVKCIASLNHEAIVRCYTVRMMPKTIVLAMEHIAGSDLHKFIANNGRLPIHVACGIAIEVCNGLQHAMNAGLVHRDIKPSNIMLYKTDGKLRAKILDFGLARLAESEQGGGLTQDGALLGTLEYISPEQSMDANKADIRSDIYSLGCTLYHMLVGHPPFSGSQGELIMAHAQKIPPTVNLIRPSLPVELAEVIARMMAKDRSRRYSTPREVAEALRPFLTRKATETPAPDLSMTGAPETHVPIAEADRDTSVEVGREKKEVQATAETKQPSAATESSKVTGDKIGLQTPKTLIATQLASSRSSVRKRRRKSPVLAVALGMLSSVIVFGAIVGVILIRTSNGTIVIENLPAEADVLVDGERVEIKWDGQQATVTAKPGERLIEVKRGDITIEGERVVVRRSEQVSFTISNRKTNQNTSADSASNLHNPPMDIAHESSINLLHAKQTWRGLISWKTGVQAANAPKGAVYELTIKEVDIADGTFTAIYRWDNSPSGHPDVGGTSEIQGKVLGNQATWKTGDVHVGKHSANLFDDRIEVTLMLPASHGSATLRLATTTELETHKDHQTPIAIELPPTQVEPPQTVDAASAVDAIPTAETPKGICLSDDPEMNAWTALTYMDPRKFRDLPENERQQILDEGQIKKQQEWQWSGGEITNLTSKVSTHLTTIQSYRDFELNLEYNMDVKGDSGVMLKETPQVQIWDTTEAGGKWNLGADKGSGGLWNNRKTTPGRDPLVRADKPFGQWNSMRIIQVGSRTSVWLNGQLVVDQAIMENEWNKSLPLVAEGRIQLQTHSGQVRWRNIYVRELPVDEAIEWLAQRDATGFNFFVRDRYSGWYGAEYVETEDFARVNPPRWGSVFHHEFEQDCTYRAQFRLLPDGNSKISILVPMRNRPKRGFVEVEIFDATKKNSEPRDNDSRVDLALAKVAVQPGYLRPPGEWNFAEYKIVGTTFIIELNGTVVLHEDLWRNAEESSVKSLPTNDKYKNRVGMAMFGSSIDNREMQFRPE